MDQISLPEKTILQDGKYEIVRFIGSGGFGCTYEARHIMLEKKVAIKEFFVKDFCNRDEQTARISIGTTSKKALVSKLKKKFVDEAKALCKLDHKGIVRVSDVFEENGTAYYVMDFVEGKSLGEIIKSKGALPEKQALGYILQVCDALEYVHGNNRLHLDIKPGNIMIDGKGNAVLIDFGASKQYDEVQGENTSTLMGLTPGFAPLEQIGNDVVKFLPATDIYALGATLYKALTSITPPKANLLAGGDPLPPLPKNISQATKNAIEAALRSNKMMRPQSIAEFKALLNAKGEEIEATVIEDSTIKPKTKQKPVVPPTPKPVDKPKKDRKVLILALVVCVIIALGVFMFMGNKGSSSVEKPKVVAETSSDVKDMKFTNSKGITFTYTGPVNSNGAPEGKGTGVYSEGTYTGYYVNGLRQGKASYDTTDKSNHFEGTYSDDEYVEGKLTFTDDGSYFEGTFKNNAIFNGKYYDNNSGKTYTVTNGSY